MRKVAVPARSSVVKVVRRSTSLKCLPTRELAMNELRRVRDESQRVAREEEEKGGGGGGLLFWVVVVVSISIGWLEKEDWIALDFIEVGGRGN